MAIEKSLVSGSYDNAYTEIAVRKDMYGYEMIDTLATEISERV